MLGRYNRRGRVVVVMATRRHSTALGLRSTFSRLLQLSTNRRKPLQSWYHSNVARPRSLEAVPRGGSKNEADSDLVETSRKHLRRVSYVTDIEGDKDYLDRYVKQSRVLCFRSSDESAGFPYSRCIDFQNPDQGDVLVFGGDVCDQVE